MDTGSNLEPMDFYPLRNDSNSLYKNCKQKGAKIEKSFSQTNETKALKHYKAIFFVQKKELISRKRKKSRKTRRPRHKTKNKKKRIIFRVTRTEKKIPQQKRCSPTKLDVKFNKFKIKKIEHRKEKKYKTKEKQNTIDNDSAKTEENHYEKNNHENLLYEDSNFSELYNQDERIGKETSELINEMSSNKEKYERPINPRIVNLPRLINILPQTRAFTLVLKEIK